MTPDQFKALPVTARMAEIAKLSGRSNAEIQRELGLNRYELSHLKRLIKRLSDNTCDLIAKNNLSEGHARALARLPHDSQDRLVRSTVQRRWSVRELEGQVRAVLEGKDAAPDAAYFQHIEQIMSDHLGHPVSIAPNRADLRRGVISITYYDLDSFEGIVERLHIPMDEF